MSARRWVIFFSAVSWAGGSRQRQHELAAQLAHAYRVLFCEPPTLGGSLRVEAEHVADGVWLHRPWGPFPLGRVAPPLNLLTRMVGSWALARWSARQGARPIVWLDEDLAATCAGRCGEAAVVYDAVDKDWVFTRPWNRRHLRRSMAKGVARADLAISSSKTLARELGGDHGHAHVITNAGDPTHFGAEGPISEELGSLARPVIGFVGEGTARKLDLELLETVARRRPEWSIVLVGPCDTVVRRALGPLANVTLLGPRPYESLPALVRGFDVSLIPYRIGGPADYVFPKKLYEYLAAGRPVVATPLPELVACGEPVRLARDADSFIRAVEGALEEDRTEDGPAAAAARRAAACEHTWEARGREVRELIAELEAA